MTKFKWVLTLLLIGCVGLIGTGCQKRQSTDSWSTIQRQKRIVIGIDDSFVPMTFRTKSGRLTGFDVDLARLVFKGSGLKVDFQAIDWDMKETELHNQTINLIWSGYSKTAQRAKKVTFSDDYLTNQQVMVTMKKAGIKSIAALQGKAVGVQTGSSGLEQMQNKPQLLMNKIANQKPILYDTYNNAFIDLQAQRIKGLLIDEVYAGYELKSRPNKQAFKVLSSPFQTEAFAVGMRPQDKQLRRLINARLKVLQKNGQLAQLKQKWFD